MATYVRGVFACVFTLLRSLGTFQLNVRVRLVYTPKHI